MSVAAAASLDAVAAAAGLARDWIDVAGTAQRVEDEVLLTVLQALQLPARTARQRADSLLRLEGQRARPALMTAIVGERIQTGMPERAHVWLDERGGAHGVHADGAGFAQVPVEPGYWTLECAGRTQAVAVAPPTCWTPAQACDGMRQRAWGAAVQVYATRGEDAGIGDAAGCVPWLQHLCAQGGHALALSPLHARRPLLGGVGHVSPYSPDDRRCLDPLQASPLLLMADQARAIRDADPALRERLEQLEQASLIDWHAASETKWDWLQRLHAQVLPTRADLQAALAGFAATADVAVHAHVCRAAQEDGRPDALHLFGQWLASAGWSDLQQQARRGGMPIGLIADLAVGFDPQGSEAADAGQTALQGLELGAPPDAFNAHGQAWGITGYAPTGLEQAGFAPFIALLRAVMRDRGGVRIDHILGLLRLWVLPTGAGAAHGVYLRYPLQDLLNLVALESWRHRCVVIGEDLGVVPDGLRTTLAARGILGLDVLQFTHDAQGRFLAPSGWRAQAVATTTTHDLPTTVGWLHGRDIDWRLRLGLCTQVQADAQRVERRQRVAALGDAMGAAGWRGATDVRAAVAFVGASSSALALIPAEDLLYLDEQPNLPGTVEGHPNWRRRLPGPPDRGVDSMLQTLAMARAPMEAP